MKVIPYSLSISSALLLFIVGTCQAGDLEQHFSNPPDSAKPGVWWHWMGCNVTKAGITRDLEAFKEAGIGGATIFGMADVCSPWAAHIENSPTDGLIAFTDPWWEMVRHAAAEGKRLGIDVGLHNCPGYTSTGGPWITPELAMQQIFQSETRGGGRSPVRGRAAAPESGPARRHALSDGQQADRRVGETHHRRPHQLLARHRRAGGAGGRSHRQGPGH